jgi:hypothetical protein
MTKTITHEQMSTTLTLTMSQPSGAALACPNCGIDLSNHSTGLDSHRQIEDLQSQIKLLTEKATAAGTPSSQSYTIQHELT